MRTDGHVEANSRVSQRRVCVCVCVCVCVYVCVERFPLLAVRMLSVGNLYCTAET